ncbi:DUF4238 domain-containing protein [Curtobacterium flaccumfaciens]|uniref:DUF4238 domain-containing protein n=1 Tax=Curtobacterium flaccumfaciens TaxID=2035 RepID=UPI003996C1E4
MGNNVQRRHHTVARTLLQGFADGAGQLVQLHRSGSEHRTSSTNATVRAGFYTVTIDGAPSTAVEEWFAVEVEGPAAELLVRARVEHVLQQQDYVPLARFAAASLLRTQSVRAHLLQIGDLVGPMTLLQYVLAREPSLGDLSDPAQRSRMLAAAETSYRKQAPLVDNTNALLRVVLRKIDELTQELSGWEWTVHRATDAVLLTGDSPVATIRTNQHGWDGILPPGAPIFLPVSPTTLIVGIAMSHRFGTTATPLIGVLTPDLSRASNINIMREAAESVFRHPDTPLPDVPFLPMALPLPDPISTWSRSDQDSASGDSGIIADEDLPPIRDAAIDALMKALRDGDGVASD